MHKSEQIKFKKVEAPETSDFGTLELKANLNPVQRAYLEMLKDKMKKILGNKTKQELAKAGDLESLKNYKAVLLEILKFLQTKETVPGEAFQNRCLDFLEKIESKVNEFHAIEALTGMDCARAWKRRKKVYDTLFLNDPNDTIQKTYAQVLAISLAGSDSPWAWEIRKKLINLYWNKESKVLSEEVGSAIAQGLIGLDSDQAWGFRVTLLNLGIDFKYLLLSLAGLDSNRAWEVRDDCIKGGYDSAFIYASLTGLDSDRAWEARYKLNTDNYIPLAFANSIAGLDSDKAWKIREQISDGYKELLLSMVCLDSERAWQKRREIFNLNKPDLNQWLAYSLSGLDSSQTWKMREDLLSAKTDESFLARELYGGTTGVALRKASEVEKN